MTKSCSADHAYMLHALRLARRGLGQTAPNPAVGCVLVKDGIVIGRGWTAPGGRPHAETQALAQAGGATRGATAYVTLEPCSHTGQTPPCAAALIAAGVARAVVAVGDPDPRVNGRGLAMLRAAGIAVSEDVCAVEAAAINAGFFLKVRQNRPLVTLKIAESLDGRITAASGESQWITGPQARAYGHLLRARHDGILAGINTVLADDPELTCRLPGLEHRSPIRIVLDSHLRLPLASKLVQTARALPVLVFTAAAGGEALKAAGVEVLRVPAGADGRPLLCEVLAVLAGRGLTRILVEGGAGVAAGFLSAGLADRLEVFSAPIVLGGGGRAAIESLSETKLCKAPRFAVTARRELGSDLLVSYRVED